MEKNRLLLIFTRNPILGKCKTRLARTVGNNAALQIYMLLLRQTVKATKGLSVDKMVCYSDQLVAHDLWDSGIYDKEVQQGGTLGERMEHAFRKGFADGYKEIIIIGSDLYDLRQADLEKAFELLDNNDFVIGPAADGGYYLLGMKNLDPQIFSNKDWGGNSVLHDTLADLKNRKLAFLPAKNDVDVYEDLLDIPAFHRFTKHIKND